MRILFALALLSPLVHADDAYDLQLRANQEQALANQISAFAASQYQPAQPAQPKSQTCVTRMRRNIFGNYEMVTQCD